MDRWSVAPLLPGCRDKLLACFDAALASARDEDRERGRCCCHRFALARAVDFDAFDARANRVAIAARIDAGELDGYLVEHEGRVAGWLNVQARHRVPHAFAWLGIAPPPIDVAPHDAAIVLCMVIAPPLRPDDVAPAAITGVLASLAARGFRVVDVFPPSAAAGLDPHEPGPAAWYAAAGFHEIGREGVRVAMRRELR